MKDKIAVVTGAGGTLCSEIAIELAKDGVTVFLVGRTQEKLQVTADKIKAAGGTEAVVCPCDVTDREAVAALATKVAEAGGGDQRRRRQQCQSHAHHHPIRSPGAERRTA